MPKKDSFTFSDKLRQSRSVPLSKRLPSIVGGQDKQKRTLVQRAQRDLPFILVAVLALLLLPFLSRTGSDDIATTGDLAWNSLADAPSFAEGGGADIMPAGSMKDPMDLILRPKSAIGNSGVTMGTEANKNAYGSENEEGSASGYSSRSRSYSESGSSSSRPDYTTRKSYDEQYTKTTTKAPATTKYGAKTRPSVRKSFERKGTEINRALRLSQLPGNKGATGVGHSLPIGQGPTRSSGGGFREGVRPIALQPMEARGGVGRSMTGENLYAEAARSINEMNRGGPAKANLLAAQMRDVDGKLTPDGAGFGGPGATGSSVKPGSVGGPGNTNGYSVSKPWWWDMMQTRSQKMWDLLYYKPREIWYTNMYNYASQLMNCLATGNKDGDVSTMFGKKAGKDDMECVRKDMLSLNDFIEQYGGSKTTSNKDGGQETETYGNEGLITKWQQLCDPKMDESSWKTNRGSRKSLLQTRFECVGLNWGWVKALFAAKVYKADCSEVNNDPMEFTYSVTKNGKTKKRLENKTVIALIAKVNDDQAKGEERHGIEKKENYYYSLKNQEIVVAAGMGTHLKATKEQLDQLTDPGICTLTKVIGFVPRADRGAVEEHIGRANYFKIYDNDDKADFSKDYKEQNLLEVDKDGNVTDRYKNAETKAVKKHESAKVNNLVHFRAQVEAAYRICTGKTTNADVHPLTLNSVYNFVDFVSQDGLLNSGVKNNSYKECTIYDRKDKPFIKDKFINAKHCYELPSFPMEMKGKQTASARITRPNDKINVFAVIVEQNDGESKAKVIYTAKMNDQATNLESDGKTATYVLETSAFGTKGFNPNQKDGVVRTDYNNSTSSRNKTNYADARDKESKEVSSYNASADARYTRCMDDCNGYKDEKLKLQCQQNCNSQSLTRGNYQGDSDSSSDGNDPKTAPGSGRVYWILSEADKLLVNAGDEFETLHDIENSQLADSIIAISYCYYRWCHDVRQCNLNDEPKDYCVDIDGTTVYIAQRIFDNNSKKYLYAKLEELGPQNRSPEGLEKCDPVCHKNGKVYKCDEKGEPEDNPILSMINIEGVKPCPDCCFYKTSDGKTNNYKSVEINGKHYIIDATPNACNKPKGQCSPAAWSEEDNIFTVYDMSQYNPSKLELIPNPEFTQAIGKDSYLVNLTILDYEDTFHTIRQQSISWSGNRPTLFELFPRLVLPTPEDITEACRFKLTFNYQNASIEPQNPDYQVAADTIMECINKIKLLKESNPKLADDYSTLYFHGFASYGGVNYENCDGKNQTGDKCNKALSEDRNLFVMDKIADLLQSQQGLSIGKESGNISYNGFTNTNYNGTPAKFPYRYGMNYADTNGNDITFKSVSYGDEGATVTDKSMSKKDIENIHAEDRFILININPTATREEASNGYTSCSTSGVCYPSPSRTP